eukprot:scaffold104_cov375-Prasinococcus_capsulatus_cf.AAC.13
MNGCACTNAAGSRNISKTYTQQGGCDKRTRALLQARRSLAIMRRTMRPHVLYGPRWHPTAPAYLHHALHELCDARTSCLGLGAQAERRHGRKQHANAPQYSTDTAYHMAEDHHGASALLQRKSVRHCPVACRPMQRRNHLRQCQQQQAEGVAAANCWHRAHWWQWALAHHPQSEDACWQGDRLFVSSSAPRLDHTLPPCKCSNTLPSQSWLPTGRSVNRLK